MKKPPYIYLYLNKDNTEDDIGYLTKIYPIRIPLYHEKNFPLKYDEEIFWDKLINLRLQNKVRKFFKKL